MQLAGISVGIADVQVEAVEQGWEVRVDSSPALLPLLIADASEQSPSSGGHVARRC